ncbi:cipC1 protein [Ramaria rubella]|nr:cipC1 protein [Ramaria rubella]
MGLLDFFNGGEHNDAYDQVNGAPHKAELSHELIAGAAAYEAAKAYEKHCEANGKHDNHAKAKEFLAAASGAFIDRIVETKGLDYVDREKAKHEAKKHAEQGLVDSGEY